MKSIVKNSDIQIKVGLNEKNIPVDIKWKASDSKHGELKECKAIGISIWDPYLKDTLSIDLWTNEMRIDEMHTHFIRTLISISESYKNATGNPFVKTDMENFCKSMISKIEEWELQKGKQV